MIVRPDSFSNFDRFLFVLKVLHEHADFNKKFNRVKIKRQLRNREADEKSEHEQIEAGGDELNCRLRVRKGYHQKRWYYK